MRPLFHPPLRDWQASSCQRALAAGLVLRAALLPSLVSAQELATSAADGAPQSVAQHRAGTREEARRRFDRGLTLYNAGDLNGALAEFRMAYKLTAHPVVLYNLALVQAGLGHAAEAVDALEMLQSPSNAFELGPARDKRARLAYEEQLLRVGRLEVKSDVPHSLIQIDGIDVARTPAPPLRVTAGTHVVSLSAPQHEPRRVNVSVAGKALEVLELQLTPVDEALAHLTPGSNLPDVELRANGELIGHTPFASDLAFRPGSYELEFTREGYVPVRRQLVLGPGSVGHVDVTMVPSDTGLVRGGLLAVALGETDAVVTVDGQPRLDYALGLRLPLGRHWLRIQRAGFFDVERDVRVHPGKQDLDVVLLPTPEYLDRYVNSARSQRLWSWVALGGGAAITGGSAAFLLWNRGQKQTAQADFEHFADQVAAKPSGTCDTDTCARQLNILVDELDARRKRDVYGWVGVSVGVAALGTGIFLWAHGPDPRRYEPAPESDVFGRLELRMRGSGLTLRGAF